MPSYTAVLLAFSLSLPLAGPKLANERCFAVAATSDIHGQVSTRRHNYQGQGIDRDGLLAYGAYLAHLQQIYAQHLLILDSGDSYQGSLASERTASLVVQQLLDHLPLTATTLGNHDWLAAHSPGPLTAWHCEQLREQISRAAYPILAANLLPTMTTAAWPNLWRAKRYRRNGIDIAIVGIAHLPDWQSCLTGFANSGRLPPVRSILPLIQQLRQEGVQFVILLLHQGGHCSNLNQPADLRSCRHPSQQALWGWLASFPQGTFDLLIGGHTHGHMGHWWQQTLLMQSGGWLQHFSWAELCFDQNNRWRRDWSTIHSKVPLCLARWADGSCGPKDLALKSSALPVQPAYFLGRPVKIPRHLQSIVESFGPTLTTEILPIWLPVSVPKVQLAYWVAQALRQGDVTQIGIYPSSGARQALPVGQLTESDLFAALPFTETLVRFPSTGEQLSRWFARQTQRGATEQGQLAITGLHWHTAQDGTNYLMQSDTQQRLLPTKAYWCATTSYLWQQDQHRLPKATGAPQVLATHNIREIMITWLSTHYSAALQQVGPIPQQHKK